MLTLSVYGRYFKQVFFCLEFLGFVWMFWAFLMFSYFDFFFFELIGLECRYQVFSGFVEVSRVGISRFRIFWISIFYMRIEKLGQRLWLRENFVVQRVIFLRFLFLGFYGVNVEDSVCCRDYIRYFVFGRMVKYYYWILDFCRRFGVV